MADNTCNDALLSAARILLVDHVEADLRLLDATLRAAGFDSIDHARDGVEALALYVLKRHDLVMLDLGRPARDGFEVLRSMRVLEPGYLPVVAVTADPDHVAPAMQCGARDVIAKPVRAAEVLLRARNVLDRGFALDDSRRRGDALKMELRARTAALQQSREIFRLFAKQIPEALWIRSPDGELVYVNPAWERLTGRPVQPGDTVRDVMAVVHPDDRAPAAAEMARFPLGGGDLVLRMVRPDGEIRWTHARSFPLVDEHGEPRWVAGIFEDITERKAAEESLERYSRQLLEEVAVRQRAQEALRDTESQFRALVEQSVAAIYIVDAGRFKYVNPRMCEILGYAAEELVGREVIEIVHGDDWTRLLANRERALQGDASALVATYRLIRKDGSVVHLGVGGRMVEMGDRRLLLGVAQDLTERLRERERRVEAESHSAAFMQQSLVGIYIRNDERMLYGNARLAEILGYGVDDIERMRIADFVIPEDRPVVAEVFQRRKAGYIGPLRVSCRIRRGDGRVVHLEVETTVIDVGGRNETVGIVQDVTERERAAEALRLSEEKYRLLWETCTDAVILMGDDCIIQYANPSVAHVFGYVPEVLEGQHIRLLQPERLRSAHQAAMGRFLATGERRLDWRRAEVVALHRDGHEFPMEISFSRLNIGGRFLFAAFMCDITEAKASQAALEDAYERMQALSERVLDVQEEERRALSLELHDDVGQSLVALRIGLHRLAGQLAPAQAQLLAECDDVAGSVQERVRELSQQLHPPQLDQLGLREALRWLAERSRAITGLDIRCSFGPEPQERLSRGLESACFRICQEALNNAIRHSRARKIAITIETVGHELQLSVTDDGVGFDPQARRAEAPASGSLGLMSMEQRARRAGGRLEVEAVPGGGTRVRASFALGARSTETARSTAWSA